MQEPLTEAQRERKRCTDLCDGLILALKMSSSPTWTRDTTEAAIATVQWLRNEINGENAWPR